MNNDILNENCKEVAGLLATDIQEMTDAIIIELKQEKPHKSYLKEKVNVIYTNILILRRMINNEEGQDD